MSWRGIPLAIAALVVAAALCLPAAASASFGFLPGNEGFAASLVNEDGSPAREAGTHPFAMHVNLGFKRAGQFSDGDLRDLDLSLPPSLFLSPTAVPECSQVQFHVPRSSPFQESLSGESCPDASQVGVVAIHSSYDGGSTRYFGVFNLTAPYGVTEAIGFAPFGVPIVLTGNIRESDAALTLSLADLPQQLSIYGIDLNLWGTPWATPGLEWTFPHDDERGNCLNEIDPSSPFGEPSEFVPDPIPGNPPVYQAGTCAAGGDPRSTPPSSYLTLPSSCEGLLPWTVSASSWQQPAAVEASALSRDTEGNPIGLEKCKAPLPSARARLTTESAASSSGFDYQLDLNSGGGLLNSLGVARPPIRTGRVELPEGLTINPSVGAGLGVCTVAEFARESADSAPGAGCPNPSKVGDIAIEGLIGIPEVVQGSVFLAKPYENPYGSLVGLYLVAKSARRGLMLKSLGNVEPDRRTGRLSATFDNLPQLLYTSFHLRLREGQRSMMISPPTCGSYTAQLELTPWTEPGARAHSSSTMPITRGEGGGSCPSGATLPFNPHLLAGSYNPVAGAYSPFLLHMTRTDSDQEFTSYSATFPPGLLAKLAGVSTCSDAAIEAAKHRTASAEEASPSCPASSRIGTSMVGEGVGQTLAYAPGALYLAGPYNGSQLSIAAITAARVGPFDLETVVVRSAIRIDPLTAQASIDAKGSDPIPHILKGIPIHVRDITVKMDRPNFTLNPTSCDHFLATSILTGAGPDVFSPADDVSATAPDRFQVLDCAALPFAPRVKMSLKGGTTRGKYPALRAEVTPRPGNANIGTASVALPASIFLAQEHLETICTRHQFDVGTCPAKSVYGKARATTPLLDEPLEGLVYLRSSSHVLPDLVTSLHARGISIEVVGRIDSIRGGLRATYDVLPDAPVSKFVMNLLGGKRGLIVNSENTCAAPQFATVRMSGQNNVTRAFKSRLGIKCKKRKQGKKHR